MCAISLGRIAAQIDETLRDPPPRGRPQEGAQHRSASSRSSRSRSRRRPRPTRSALDAIEGKNRQPTTQRRGHDRDGHPRRRPCGRRSCKKLIEESEHPVLRGCAALAAGMLGDDKVQSPDHDDAQVDEVARRDVVRRAGPRAPRQEAGLGPARQAPDGDRERRRRRVQRLRARPDEGPQRSSTRWSTSRRTTATSSSSRLRSRPSATSSSAEDYPRRHLMARGFNYMLNLQPPRELLLQVVVPELRF